MTRNEIKRGAGVILLTTLAIALSACSPPPASQGSESARKWGSLTFEPCTLESKQGFPAEAAYCTKFAVPENPAMPEGRKIDLNVAWIPANNAGDLTDPVLFLAGGPGQAAVEYASFAANILNDANKNRDLLILDQRGTGNSGKLSCPKTDDANKLDDLTATPAKQLEVLRKCHEEVALKADTRFYTTANFVNDIEAVRKAIGATQLNLVGISYGTRAAQKYAQAYPQNVRTMILDGVAPNRLVIGEEFAQGLDAALRKQDAYCTKIPSCRKMYGGNLAARLKALRIKLDASPATVQVRNGETNTLEPVTVNGARLVGLVQMLAYSPEMMSILPLLIKQAEAGDYQPLGALSASMTSSNSSGIEPGLYMSVICAEDVPRWKPNEKATQSLLGRDFQAEYAAACEVWPAGTAQANFVDTPTSQVPTLLLSGELDPVTPPSYAAEIGKFYPNSRSLVLKGGGHGALMRGCASRLAGQFIERADAKSLDTKCLDSLSFIPPFTSFNGWDP